MSKNDKKTRSKKILNPDNSRKGNYKIFALDFYHANLRTIQTEVLKQVKNCIRKNVLGFSLNDIIKDVFGQDDFLGNNKISLNDGELNNVLVATMDRILQYKTNHELMEEAIKTKNEFDLLKYWEMNFVPEETKRKPTKSGKLNPGETRNSGGKEKRKSKGSKVKEEVGTFPKIKCVLSNVNNIDLFENVYSSVKRRNPTETTHTPKFLDDNPHESCQLYIVIIGHFSGTFYQELIRKGAPLQAIIYLKDAKQNDLNLENELKLLRTIDDTKSIAIFEEKALPISKCMALKHSLDIFNEVCWYLYDCEFLYCEKYMSFLAHFVEVNVNENAAFPVMHSTQFSDIFKSDFLHVKDFLQSLIDEIDPEYIFEETCQEPRHDIFISNRYGVNIFEEPNMLAKCKVNAEIEINEYLEEIRKVKKNFACIHNEALNKYACMSLKYDPMFNNTTVYYELLSDDSFYQRFYLLYCNFDKIEFFSDPQYILVKFRRSLNKIYEITRKHDLLTKVCFRDFCEYVYPKIGDQIKTNYKSHNSPNENKPPTIEVEVNKQFLRIPSLKYSHIGKLENSYQNLNTQINTETNRIDSSNFSDNVQVFHGYNLGDKYVNLTCTETIFRSYFGYIKITKNSWLYKSTSLSINVNILGYDLIYHRKIPIINKLDPKLRILTPNGIVIMTDIKTGYTMDNEEVHMPQVHIRCPNGLMITNLDNGSQLENRFSPSFILQEPAPNSGKEIRRIFMDGSVLIYYNNGTVRILRYNGTIYRTSTNITSTSQYESSTSIESFAKIETQRDNGAGGDYTFMLTLDQKYSAEINFMSQLEAQHDFDCKNYHLTTVQGNNFEVRNKQIIYENHKFITSENMDYSAGKVFTIREDGVKCIASKELMQCFFEDGTIISTTMGDRFSYLSDDENEEDYEDEDSVKQQVAFEFGSKEEVVRRILDELLKIVTGEIFISCVMSFFIEHGKYASVHFTEDNTTIYSPSEIKISLSQDDLLISIGGDVSFNYNVEECIFSANECAHTAKIPLKLTSTTKLLLEFANEKSLVQISDEGLWSITELINNKLTKSFQSEMLRVNGESGPSRDVVEERTLVLPLISENRYCYEILSASEVKRLLETCDAKICKHNKETGLSVVLKEFVLKEEQLVARPPPDPVLQREMAFTCQENKKHLKQNFTFRCFFQHSGMDTSQYDCCHSTDYIIQDIVNRSQQDIENDIAGLVDKCLVCSFENDCPSLKAPYDVDRVEYIKKNALCKDQRRHIYNAILSKREYPKYEQFHDSGDNIAQMNVNVFKNICHNDLK